MNVQRVLALLLVLSLRMAAQQSNAHTTPKPDERFKADVLLIVAHPDDVLQRILGHSDLASTERYLGTQRIEVLQAKVEGMNAGIF